MSKQAEQGLPEWIMSYADMITIMMAFFVVMYATAGGNKEQTQARLQSLRAWLGGVSAPWPDTGGPREGHGSARRSRYVRGSDPATSMIVVRKGELATPGVSLYFAEQLDRLSAEQRQKIAAFAQSVAGHAGMVGVQAHWGRRPLPPEFRGRDKRGLAFQACQAVATALATDGIASDRIVFEVAAAPHGSVASDAKLDESLVRVDLVQLFEPAPAEPPVEAPATPVDGSGAAEKSP
ncbi:MAG: flagellar motor protein MotB [Pirellulales bacterium]